MTEPITPAAPVAPTEAPKSAEAPKAPAAAAPAEQAAQGEPSFLADRLERERRATLKKIGVKVSKDVPLEQAIAEERGKREKRKERLQKAETERDSIKAEVEGYKAQLAALKTYADLELAGLSEPQRALVKQVAGEDPSAQLTQIAVLRTFGAQTVAASAPTAAAAPAPIAAPASSSPNAPAPMPPPPGQEPDLKAQYAKLKTITDPTQRAAALAFFTSEHGRALLG